MNTSTTGNPVRRMYGKANQSGTTITNVRNTTETGGQTGHYSGTHDSTILPSTETDLHNVLFILTIAQSPVGNVVVIPLIHHHLHHTIPLQGNRMLQPIPITTRRRM